MTEPFGYDAITYFTVASNGNAGGLSNTVSSTTVDVGMAMEWRRSFLSPTTSMTIDARVVASVSQPTPTPTATPTATATSTPEPTPTSTPTVAPTPTSVATAAPNVPADSIPGRILNPVGEPVPNVVVYLYRRGASVSEGTTASERLTGVGNQITDADGAYLFSDPPEGTYRLQALLNDAAYEPATIDSRPGTFVSITQVKAPTIPDGCTSDSHGAHIVASDGAGLAQLASLKEQVERSLNRARRSMSGSRLAAFRGSLNTAQQDAERRYTQLLNITEGLPKIVLNCADNSA